MLGVIREIDIWRVAALMIKHDMRPGYWDVAVQKIDNHLGQPFTGHIVERAGRPNGKAVAVIDRTGPLLVTLPPSSLSS